MLACSFEYAIVRVVPRVERHEFLNAGVIVFCTTERFLDARVELARDRLLSFAPTANADLIEEHLQIVPRVCVGGRGSGPIGQLTQRERFHWLVAPRSTIIQISPVHSGLCDNPQWALEHLFNTMVRPLSEGE